MTDAMRAYWNEQAADFDADADHGLRDPTVRQAWSDLLLPLMPPAPARILDVGVGTGSLASLLTDAGHEIVGLDLAEQMLQAARAKTAGLFVQADAAHPPFRPQSFDAVLDRHVLWAVPDPAGAIRRWTELLRPDGRLVLVEGRWDTGGGITAAECAQLVRRHRSECTVRLLPDAALWGREISDERYLVVS